MTKTNLIESLEKAEGPCRELDAAICAALRVFPPLAPEWLNNWSGPVVPMEKIKGRVAALNEGGDIATHWNVPEVTLSIDAALTLVPDGMRWGVGVSACNSYVAQIWYDDEYEFLAEVIATSPALALSAAALRAIGDDDDER